jgi:predicted nucleic acid-binding protein
LDVQRAEDLQSLGFDVTDSLHVVAAEKGRCDVLLTTDDKLIRKSHRHKRTLRVPVVNPVDWLREVTG